MSQRICCIESDSEVENTKVCHLEEKIEKRKVINEILTRPFKGPHFGGVTALHSLSHPYHSPIWPYMDLYGLIMALYSLFKGRT